MVALMLLAIALNNSLQDCEKIRPGESIEQTTERLELRALSTAPLTLSIKTELRNETIRDSALLYQITNSPASSPGTSYVNITNEAGDQWICTK